MTTTEEKLAGNLMKVFQCQSEVDGVMNVFELKYELQTCKHCGFAIKMEQINGNFDFMEYTMTWTKQALSDSCSKRASAHGSCMRLT